jgi:hypothetical protein
VLAELHARQRRTRAQDLRGGARGTTMDYVEAKGLKGESEPPAKVIGRRLPPPRGIEHAAPFLQLVIDLRGSRPFIPRGVHRFASFEESQEWSMRMMARSRRGHQP